MIAQVLCEPAQTPFMGPCGVEMHVADLYRSPSGNDVVVPEVELFGSGWSGSTLRGPPRPPVRGSAPCERFAT